MSLSVVSRSAWGATPWRGTVHSVAATERTEFFVHYHGTPPPASTGFAVPKNVEKIHLNNGWSGVGYNFMVDQSGVIYEGRGWNGVGAHCPNHNRAGVGVYVALGGDQEPSAAALRAVLAVYQEASKRAGRALKKLGHRDGKSTACPGDKLYAWVRSGFPVEGFGSLPEDAPSDKPYLRMGSQGRHVEALQQDLIKLGYQIKADGDFGPATNHAVVTLQEGSGLVGDGVVGPKTYEVIAARLSDKPAPAVNPTVTPAPAPKADRHLGLKTPLLEGQDVKNVQNALLVGMYLTEDDVTGKYDRKTADAVNKFNKDHGIKGSGTTKDTWVALRDLVHGQKEMQ